MHPLHNEFTATLVSNASLDIYPNNHVFNFTNILAETLTLSRHEQWRVCLQSISLTNINDEPELQNSQNLVEKQEKLFLKSLEKIENLSRVNRKEYFKAVNLLYGQAKGIIDKKLEIFHKTNTLFIECDQIIPKYGTQPILSSFIIPPTHPEAEFYHYEPATEEYFDLVSPEIAQFSFRILNATKEKISRTASQATIIVLKFKKMANTRHSYAVTIDNDNQPPEKFYAKFPVLESLDPTINWEMAVTRVSFVPHFRKIPSGGYTIRLITDVDDFLTQLTSHTWNEYLDSKPQESINLEYSEHYAPSTLLAPLAEAFKAICKKKNLNGVLDIVQNTHLTITVTPNETTEENKKKPCLIILPEKLIYVLGFDSPGIVFHDGYGALPSTYGKTLKAKRKVNLNFLVPQNLLLYADCVQPSVIGNAYGKYLTNIPIPMQDSKSVFDLSYVVYEPKNLEFHPLHQSDINHVLIQLLRTDGNPPEFMTNQVKLFISFLIRKIRPSK